MIKLIATAAISLAVGAGGTFATMRVTTTCAPAEASKPLAEQPFMAPSKPFVLGNDPKY